MLALLSAALSFTLETSGSRERLRLELDPSSCTAGCDGPACAPDAGCDGNAGRQGSGDASCDERAAPCPSASCDSGCVAVPADAAAHCPWLLGDTDVAATLECAEDGVRCDGPSGCATRRCGTSRR